MEARYRFRRGLIAVACALAIGLSACSSDDEKSSGKASTTTSTETSPKVSAEFQEYCDAARDQSKQDSFPSAKQIQTLVDSAPADISAPINVVGPQLIAAGSDPVAQFNAFSADDVEAAIAEINAWETENCKIPHEPDGPGEGASREIDPAATRVDVAMSEYAFAFDEPVAAGPTSFVATNIGEQAHFMLVAKLADGVTLDEALKSDDQSKMVGQWSSGFAAAGGADEEVLTVDLKPGTYGMLCFVSDPDGTPHAMKGMAKEFTVT